eukprot:362628-Prymnesium_polylepis.1
MAAEWAVAAVTRQPARRQCVGSNAKATYERGVAAHPKGPPTESVGPISRVAPCAEIEGHPTIARRLGPDHLAVDLQRVDKVDDGNVLSRQRDRRHVFGDVQLEVADERGVAPIDGVGAVEGVEVGPLAARARVAGARVVVVTVAARAVAMRAAATVAA